MPISNLSSSEPLVTAMMPAYNEEAVIGDAIESILAQSYEHWELVIVDDGSTDNTERVATSFSDARIRYFRQTNQGRGAARNAVLGKARGDFIAITDADDISLPHRFEREVLYLQEHPEIGVVAGQMLYFSDDLSPRWLFKYPETPAAIHNRFARGAIGLAHATAMIRFVVYETIGAYSTECRQAQDLELLLHAADHFAFAALPDVLVHYRGDPRRLRFRDWLLTTQYTHYAGYRYHQQQNGKAEEDFSAWRRNPLRWPGWLTYDVVRYLRFKRLCQRLDDPQAVPHTL